MILQPIIDIVQYHVFCDKVKQVLIDTAAGLSKVGVDSSLRFDIIGESGQGILRLLAEDSGAHVGGEAVLRIDDRQVGDVWPSALFKTYIADDDGAGIPSDLRSLHRRR